MGQEVEAAAAEAARVEKRLRADVDHSLQQLATELNTETELRTKRLTELASDVSQLHSQVCFLSLAVSRAEWLFGTPRNVLPASRLSISTLKVQQGQGGTRQPTRA